MNLSQRIMSVFPADRILRIGEVHELVAQATETVYKRESIRAVLFRLHKSGSLRRIKAGRTWRNVRYCRPECAASPEPITLQAWAVMVQSESDRELNPVEIMVRMIECGYQPQVEPSEAVKHLRWVL